MTATQTAPPIDLPDTTDPLMTAPAATFADTTVTLRARAVTKVLQQDTRAAHTIGIPAIQVALAHILAVPAHILVVLADIQVVLATIQVVLAVI